MTRVYSLETSRIGRMTIRHTISLFFVALCIPGVSPAAEGDVNFSRDILPLLSDNCFKCHGPDAANRKAKLRFDKHEASLQEIEDGRAIIFAGNYMNLWIESRRVP